MCVQERACDRSTDRPIDRSSVANYIYMESVYVNALNRTHWVSQQFDFMSGMFADYFSNVMLAELYVVMFLKHVNTNVQINDDLLQCIWSWNSANRKVEQPISRINNRAVCYRSLLLRFVNVVKIVWLGLHCSNVPKSTQYAKKVLYMRFSTLLRNVV